MPPHLLQFALATLVMIGVAFALRALLGTRRRADPVLWAGSIVAAGCLLGGLVGVIRAESNGWSVLGFGIVGGFVMLRRLRASQDASAS